MQEHIPTYDEALSLLKEFNRSESLLKHAYSVEGVMRHMARKRGEDEGKWCWQRSKVTARQDVTLCHPESQSL